MRKDNKPKRGRYLLAGLLGGVVVGWYYSPNITNIVEKAKQKIRGTYTEHVEERAHNARDLVRTDSIDQKITQYSQR